jgi:hypothetical protein
MCNGTESKSKRIKKQYGVTPERVNKWLAARGRGLLLLRHANLVAIEAAGRDFVGDDVVAGDG